MKALLILIVALALPLCTVGCRVSSSWQLGRDRCGAGEPVPACGVPCGPCQAPPPCACE